MVFVAVDQWPLQIQPFICLIPGVAPFLVGEWELGETRNMAKLHS